MNYTTIEQSKKLLELGLNPETADMWWTPLNWQLTEYYVEVKQDGIGTPKNPLPCWSLGALLELIPDIPDCTILFAKSECEYGMCITPLDSGLALNEIEANNPFEVVYNMIVWLLENGYIKTEKK
jgi:hypothetical protein